MKNVLFEQKKIKLCNKQHFVENKTEVMQQTLEIQYISLSEYIKWISKGVFLLAMQVNTNLSNTFSLAKWNFQRVYSPKFYMHQFYPS